MSSDNADGLFSKLRKLATHSLVYGAADVFTNVVNLLLVPLYTSFLTQVDYGNLALLKLVKEPKAVGQVINIGNTGEISIMKLAERVRELSGSKSSIKLVPYDEAYESGFEDMPRRVPDLTKVTALIGYKPRFSLDDILSQVIEYFRGK